MAQEEPNYSTSELQLAVSGASPGDRTKFQLSSMDIEEYCNDGCAIVIKSTSGSIRGQLSEIEKFIVVK